MRTQKIKKRVTNKTSVLLEKIQVIIKINMVEMWIMGAGELAWR